MRLLFYSNSCNFCLKLLEYIQTNKLEEYFKLICIDKTNNIPKNITHVPTIIDTEIEAPLEGKKAFEYVINQKYFNHPTNNVEYIKNGVPVPKIEEDSKAISSGFINNLYKDMNITTETIQNTPQPPQQQTVQEKPVINKQSPDPRLAALMRLRG